MADGDAARDADAPAPVRQLGIAGVGLIGGSIALAIRRAWPHIRVVGVDRGEALAAARFLTAFDALGDDLRTLRDADLVVLAAPVRQNIAILDALAGTLDRQAVVTDVGSTKRATLEASRALPPHLSFVGGHPLAGAARGGLSLARADLFRGRPWLLTPGPATRDPGDVDRVAAVASAFGAIPRVIDADAHDRLFAYLSHLPQLAASALMHTVGSAVGAHLALAGPGLVDTTRLASSPASIWQDICATNADDIRPALDALIAALGELRDGLAGDGTLARVFDDAARWREEMTGTEARSDERGRD